MTEITAVLWDFGGVILESPFEAFGRYEREHGLPPGFLRRVNASNPDANAWALLERGQLGIDGFAQRYRAETRALGHEVDGRAVLGLLGGAVRPEMAEAVRRCAARFKIGLLTNNFVDGRGDGAGDRTAGAPPSARTEIAEILALFDVVIESSRAGCRKPDPRFYELACAELEIQPHEAVFLDDLGINLKPARNMGMRTIKVSDPATALAELETIVDIPLR